MFVQNCMRVFFHLLYHPFAFAYDLVAASVSLGQWTNWISEILPFLKGKRILELGHGPGHLQRALRSHGFDSAALDESPQMGTIAARRLGSGHQLTRGLAQDLPFADASFDTVVSTFPTEYIFDPRTLSSVRRVLRGGGRLIVLPVVFPKSGFLKWLYKITGESPAALNEALQGKFKQPFIRAGLETELQIIEVKSGRLAVIVASKYNTHG
jgi:ubiquinone/menaquinone biosynthesis C-methylase UbiE